MSATGKYCLDANIFIGPWIHSYRQPVFPSLWEKLADNKEQCILIKPMFDEIKPYISKGQPKPPLHIWLDNNMFCAEKVEPDVNKKALLLEKKYETVERGAGANKNDILLIAYAQYHQKTVVTLEAQQLEKPKKISKYKIPLICKEEDVTCIDFITLLENINITV